MIQIPGMQIIAWVLILSGLFITGTTLIESVSPDQQERFLNNFDESAVEATKNTGLFLFSYNSVTPSLRYEWFGDPEKQTLWLEQFPLPDKTDAFVVLFSIIIAFSLGRMVWKAAANISPGIKVLGIVGGFILFILIIWVLYKTLMFNTMLSSGEELGFSRAEISEVQRAEWDNAMKIYTPGSYIGIGLFTFGLLIMSMLMARKKNGG